MEQPRPMPPIRRRDGIMPPRQDSAARLAGRSTFVKSISNIRSTNKSHGLARLAFEDHSKHLDRPRMQ